MTTTQNTVTDESVDAFVARCQVIIDEYMEINFDTQFKTLSVKKGKRYYKIVAASGMKVHRDTIKPGSVWAFVDSTNGDILKPASWAAPAKHARGNLFDSADGMAMIGPYGPAYLR
tara:strand:+ start:286 stop:633 length:348 start_codon:yes stop_codon:yes gene_type:complete